MQVQWEAAPGRDTIASRRFTIEADGRRIPGAVWHRAGANGKKPLLLIGHGGSQHKESPEVLEMVDLFCGKHGFVVAAIDGPVHGARRTTHTDDRGAIRDEFLGMWAKETRIADMTADWLKALDVVAALPEVDPASIGWLGVSMGTAYGLPVCAATDRIRAALLGMWSGRYANSGELLAAAPKVNCPTLFQLKWDDSLFGREGQIELFTALGTKEKRLNEYPGGHVNPAGDQLEDIERFLVRHLAP